MLLSLFTARLGWTVQASDAADSTREATRLWVTGTIILRTKVGSLCRGIGAANFLALRWSASTLNMAPNERRYRNVVCFICFFSRLASSTRPNI